MGKLEFKKKRNMNCDTGYYGVTRITGFPVQIKLLPTLQVSAIPGKHALP